MTPALGGVTAQALRVGSGCPVTPGGGSDIMANADDRIGAIMLTGTGRALCAASGIALSHEQPEREPHRAGHRRHDMTARITSHEQPEREPHRTGHRHRNRALVNVRSNVRAALFHDLPSLLWILDAEGSDPAP